MWEEYSLNKRCFELNKIGSTKKLTKLPFCEPVKTLWWVDSEVYFHYIECLFFFLI